MASTKLTDLTVLGTAPNASDPLYIVDVTDLTDSPAGTSKKILFSTLTTNLATSGANSNITSLSGLTTPLSVSQGGTGRATLTSATLLAGNGTSAVSLYTTTGSGTVVALATSPVLVTPTLGIALATSINGLTLTTTTGILTIASGKTLTANSSLTLTGADSKTLTVSDSATLNTNSIALAGGEVITFSATNALSLLTTGTSVMTFPTATDTVAVLGTAQTYTATQTAKQIIYTNNAIAASSNAATVPITFRLNTVTNSSAATLTITMTTTSAVDGQMSIVRVLDFSAVAQTITWVNTENSTVTAPTTSNGSTTLFLTVGFIYNGATSKWRCIASS